MTELRQSEPLLNLPAGSHSALDFWMRDAALSPLVAGEMVEREQIVLRLQGLHIKRQHASYALRKPFNYLVIDVVAEAEEVIERVDRLSAPRQAQPD